MSHRKPCLIACTALFAAAAARAEVLHVPSVEYPSIASAVEAAGPDDTVLIAPGDYPRSIQVDKSIRVEGSADGVVRVAGLEGSAAHVTRLTFDATLLTSTQRLVTAGDGLTLESCRFEGAVQGVLVTNGGVTLEDCVFINQIQAVTVEPGVQAVAIGGTSFTDCSLGLVGVGEPGCPAGERRAADPCSGGGCGVLTLDACSFQGGGEAVMLGPGWDLQALDCSFQAVRSGIVSIGSRIRIEDSVINGSGPVGTGLDLVAASGHVRRSTVSGFGEGIVVGDAGCAAYTTVVIGGTLSRGNAIGSNLVGLRVDQPEGVNADYNYWATFDCAEAQEAVEGQAVHVIADVLFLTSKMCSVPTDPTTWGRLKLRGGRGRP